MIRQWWQRLQPAGKIVLLATLAIFLLNAGYSVWRYAIYESHAFDLGIFDQAVWHLARFERPASTVRDVTNLFGDHFHPIIITLVPLYWIFHSPVVLLVAQAALFSLVAPLAYLLGKQVGINSKASTLFGTAFALNPGLTTALGFDFHELAFSVPLLLLTFLLAEKKRWRWFTLVAALLILTKESLPIYTALIGLWLVFRRQWKPGIVTIVASVIAYAVITRAIIPALSDDATFVYWEQYRHLAAAPSQLPTELLINPWQFINALFDQPEKRATMLQAFATFGFLPLLSWATLPLIAATLAERFWSDLRALWLFQFHYQLMMVPLFGAATLYAIRDLKKFVSWKHLPLAASILVFSLTVLVHFQVGSLTILADRTIQSRPVHIWNATLKNIPATAAVSAQDGFVAHLSQRQTIYRYPRIREAQFIVLDPHAASFPLTAAQIRQEQAQLLVDGQWSLFQRNGEFTVFTRNDTAWIPDRADDPATRR